MHKFLGIKLLILFFLGVFIQNVWAENKTEKIRTDFKKLVKALESYYDNTVPHAYPPSTTALVKTYLSKAKPLMIDEPLYDPFAGTNIEYNYKLASDSQSYVIYSIGPSRNESIDAPSPSFGLPTDLQMRRDALYVHVYNHKCMPQCTNHCGDEDGCGGICGCFGKGSSCCNGSCEFVIMDSQNCGVCGNVCKSGEICGSGKCIVNSNNNESNCTGPILSGNIPLCCNGKWVEGAWDNNNCGHCGYKCEKGKECKIGGCL